MDDIKYSEEMELYKSSQMGGTVNKMWSVQMRQKPNYPSTIAIVGTSEDGSSFTIMLTVPDGIPTIGYLNEDGKKIKDKLGTREWYE